MKKFVYFIIILVSIQNFNAQVFHDTIPFRNDLGLIIIPLKFNNQVKHFAFDTGAENSVAYGWAKESLKRTNKTITINSSGGLRSKLRFYKSGKIKIGSKTVSKHRILNAPKNEIFSCHKIDGILGVDIIKLLNWTIDFENKILVMHPKSYLPKKGNTFHALQFDFYKNRPYVFLNHKQKYKLQFLLDTGAGGLSNISKNNYNLTNLDDLPTKNFYSGSFDVNGILTTTKPVIFKLKNTISKNVTLSPIISYNNRKTSKIGNDLWKNKKLFLSLKKDVFFVSQKNINQKYEGYSCSVMIRDGKMRILKIEKDSELWKIGLRQGDEILKFNNRTFTDFCELDTYQRNLAKTAKTAKSFEITLLNNQKVIISKNVVLEE